MATKLLYLLACVLPTPLPSSIFFFRNTNNFLKNIWSLPNEYIYAEGWQTLWFYQSKKILFIKRLANYPWHFKCLNCPWAESVKIQTQGYTLPIDLVNLTYSDSKSQMNLSCWTITTFQAGKQCEEPVNYKAANFVSKKVPLNMKKLTWVAMKM